MRRLPNKFVQDAYLKNDEWAINKVKVHLANCGYALKRKDKEDYNIDITAFKDGELKYFEVEVKSGYPFTSQEDFRFDTVSFLGRKKKWTDKNFWYIIVCKETLCFVSCRSDIIYRDKHREKLFIETPNRHGEDIFYRVPKDKCYWGKL